MKVRKVLSLLAGGLLFIGGCSLGTVGTLPVSITPSSATVMTGQTVQFAVSVNGSPYTQSLTWSVNGITGGNAASGTVSSTGLYTAPSSVPSSSTVTVAANQQGTTTQGTQISVSVSAQVTIVSSSTSPPQPSANISVSPSTIASGQNATLSWSSANVSGCAINGASTINGVAVGTSGSVQVSPSQTTSYQINCNSSNGPVSNTAQLTVQPPAAPAVSISPSTGTLESGQVMQFTATVANDPSNQGVIWSSTSIPNPAVINAFTATYTAPVVTQNTTVQITATSIAYPNVSGSVFITIVPNTTTTTGWVQVTISPLNINLVPGQTQTFIANVTGPGVTSQAISWSLKPSPGVTQFGTLTQTGPNTATYVAPNVTSLATVGVVATSVQFPAYSATSVVGTAPPSQ